MTFEELHVTDLVIISMSDITSHPLFKELQDKPNGLEAMLYSMGLDIVKPYETMFCTHRSPMTNKIVTCERFAGNERTDDVWKALKKRLINGAL